MEPVHTDTSSVECNLTPACLFEHLYGSNSPEVSAAGAASRHTRITSKMHVQNVIQMNESQSRASD
jgi:hypothetical protein